MNAKRGGSRRGLPSGAAAVADKRFRRPDVRPGSRGRVGVILWRAGRVAAVVALLVAAGFFVTERVVDAHLLAVSRVVVYGNQRLSVGEIEALIGSVRGENLLLVDLERFQARLLDSPWVASVTLRRVLPSTVEVRIVEREPMAVARLGQQLYLVDETGVIIDDFGPQHAGFDFPIVDGLASPGGVGPAIDPERSALASRFLGALASRPDLRRRISQIDVSAAHNVVVLFADDLAWLHLGDSHFLERLRTYLELAPTFADRLANIDYVDLRYDSRVYVKQKK